MITKAFIMVSVVSFFADVLDCLALIRWMLSFFVRPTIDDTLITIAIRFTVTAQYNNIGLER